MRPEYIGYFQTLWEREYSPSDFMPRFAPVLEAQEKLLEIRLRIDAKCFLFLNFRDMVCRLLVDYKDEDMRTDIYHILEYAKTYTGPGEEVSAHSVLNSIQALWKVLIFPTIWG